MSSTTEALAGRTAVITGSGRNIGRAIALAMARNGARVVVNGHRDRQRVDQVVDEVRAEGGEAIGVMADVSSADEVGRLVAEATEAFGPVDVAVSNVGVRRRQAFEEITVEDWHATLGTNLHAAFYLAHHTLPAMRTRGWGRVIHISGYDGWTGHIGERAHNVTAKAGLHGLTKAIAREYGAFGVTANTVAPGAIATVRDPDQYGHVDVDEVRRRLAVPHFGRPDDVAAACVYLAGESGRFVTGQVVHVNGGEFMF
ncbi:MAG TPA: SDR family oxidoreductase [Acidimicrobiales bacterium]|nr:SDR family oxidoreductase [Acidimicrobiales bacterium]